MCIKSSSLFLSFPSADSIMYKVVYAPREKAAPHFPWGGRICRLAGRSPKPSIRRSIHRASPPPRASLYIARLDTFFLAPSSSATFHIYFFSLSHRKKKNFFNLIEVGCLVRKDFGERKRIEKVDCLLQLHYTDGAVRLIGGGHVAWRLCGVGLQSGGFFFFIL